MADATQTEITAFFAAASLRVCPDALKASGATDAAAAQAALNKGQAIFVQTGAVADALQGLAAFKDIENMPPTEAARALTGIFPGITVR